MIDLEAIRARHEERMRNSAAAMVVHQPTAQACVDIDALIAEVERQATILSDVRATLRLECGEVGDNDWPDDLHPSDAIEKHLVRPLLAEVERLRAALGDDLERYDTIARILACPHDERGSYRCYALGPKAPRQAYCAKCGALLDATGKPESDGRPDTLVYRRSMPNGSTMVEVIRHFNGSGEK